MAMIPPLQFDNWQWLSLQLATPVVLWAGWPFHKAAWQNLKHGEATMDTLISVGTLAAWAWSLYALFLGEAGQTGMTMSFDLLPDRGGGTDEIYLEVAAVVTAFISPAVTSRHARSAAPGRRFKLCSSWGPRTLAYSMSTGVSAASRSTSCPLVSASSSGPGRRSPPTAWSRTATRRSTIRP